jgi:hypothetical protein
MSSFVPSRVGVAMDRMRSSGAPTARAASCMMRHDSTTHSVARGCGDMTIALRAFTAIRAL